MLVWVEKFNYFLSFFFSLPDKCLDAYLYQVLTSVRKNMLLKLLKKVTVLQKVSYDTKVRRKKARKTTSGNSQEDVRQLKRRCTLTQCNSSNSNAAEDTNTSASFDDTRESSSPDCSDVTVMTLRKKKHGGWLYNKKFYCKFCCKPFSKMAHHLQSKHKDKPEVAKAMAFQVGSKEQKIQLSLLRTAVGTVPTIMRWLKKDKECWYLVNNLVYLWKPVITCTVLIVRVASREGHYGGTCRDVISAGRSKL